MVRVGARFGNSGTRSGVMVRFGHSGTRSKGYG